VLANTTRTSNQDENNKSGNNQLSVPSISLPKGGGAIRGLGEKFAANPVTGTGSMTVPIATSPGRSGFGPQLSLSYDSGAGNGPFGFGWSLSLPSITRKTDKGLPQYWDNAESDVYILSGAEDLVPVLQADGSRFVDDTIAPGYTVYRYRPRIEGLFTRIERWLNNNTGEIHWRSISRDNITTLYGKTAESRVADPGDPGRVFTWLICESYDDKGNAIVYSYAAEDDANIDHTQANERNRVRTANRYLKRIRYGNLVSRLIQPDLTKAQWMFEVVFDYDEGHYEELALDPTRPVADQHQLVRASILPEHSWSVRPDPFSSYRASFEVRTYRRCRRVLLFHRFAELGSEPYLTRSTEFNYGDLDYSQPTTIEDELTYQGSTRFASFIRAITQSGFVRDDTQAMLVRNGVRYVTYIKKSLPPLEFEYSKAHIQDDIRDLAADSLENLPIGLDGTGYQWVDLDGEGVSGMLTEQADAWFYKPNLGEGKFGPLEVVPSQPSLAALSAGRQRLLDLSGDGQLDLVALTGSAQGFYRRTQNEDWDPFKTFALLPDISWGDPNLRFVDPDGDGLADVLITQQDVFTWYPSLAEDGFGPATQVHQPLDEEQGPRLLLADGTQSIYLADMSGDGLSDLVRIRDGEVCYWPNQGYGQFGAMVTMDNAPWFDSLDQFDQRRIRLADIDGSGTTDIIYLGRENVRLYFNQSGNRLSEPRRLGQFPPVDNLDAVTAADLLGNGTACLVWSSPLPTNTHSSIRYIDLMSGQKPHLLIRSVNNLGAETRVQYVSSTTFYLADKLEGQSWITKLPFPVYVVERVETYDRISGNRFVTRYAYHHGYFDGFEREFRGFGLVEQWDTEEFAALNDGQQFPIGTNIDASSHVPPVMTRTWFHTGIYLGRDHISDFFAGFLGEKNFEPYYREPGLSDAQARQLLLDDSALPARLTVDEEREACRALKGSLLRQEIYALDGSDKEKHPYTITEKNFTIHLLQPKAGNRHAVFYTHGCEAISYHYERNPADPRISHTLTMEVDAFGNVLKSAIVGYGRRKPDPSLALQDQEKQTQVLVTYTENDFTNSIAENDAYRTPLPCDVRTYELTGYIPSGSAGRFQISDFVQPSLDGLTFTLIFDSEIAYEEKPVGGKQRRLIDRARIYYRPNDLGASQNNPSALLPFQHLESLALLGESYKLAFTPGLIAQVYGGRATSAQLESDGHYVHREGDTNWWIPSGRMFYSLAAAGTPQQELAQARAHFFLPRRYRNPFHTDAVSTETSISYDTYDLLMQETQDALGNRITVGERNIDPTQPLVRAGQDYRLLQPALVMDPNRNRSAAAFDAFGMVVGTAAMGKPEDNPRHGDMLDDLDPDLTDAVIGAHLQDPLANPYSILQRATARLIYDLFAYYRTKDQANPQPAVVYTLARETHDADLVPGQQTKVQHSFSYSDGFSREIQKKIQAEPGPVPKRDPTTGRIIVANGQPAMTPNDVSPCWVGSGWTVFNNKGKPVRQYEPFFTDTHRFEFDVRIGVSPVLCYDPVERVVATLHPNHTWEKIVFDPWKQETWDVNDMVMVADPKNDSDVGDFFSRLPEADYLPTWLAQRQSGALGPEEQDAASKAVIHANTPTVAHLDMLGRLFLTVAHNKFKRSDTPQADPPGEEFYLTRTVYDTEGNQREVIDAKGRVVMRYDYNMLSNRVHQASMEAGEHWMLKDAADKPLYAWDSRDHQFRTAYDQLRRPTDVYLREGAGLEVLVRHTIHGETHPNPEASNLRNKVVQVFDQAGVVTSDEYDFKDNLLHSQRQLAQEYKATLNWSAAVPLEAPNYSSSTSYDALNRVTEQTAPDSSVIRNFYNEASLLERVEVNLGGAAVATPFVSNIDYDAKGQRTRIDYSTRDGKGISTTYAYDSETFRLLHLKTSRNASDFNGTDRPGEVQNLHYTYDPVGNIAYIRDDAQQTVYFRNRLVEPSNEYTYDAVYWLIEARGREHLGQTNGQLNPPTAPDAFNIFHTRLDHPGDGNALGTYIERYFYDSVGNILAMQHRGSSPQNPGWTRTYTYNEISQLEAGKVSNRLSNTSLGATTETYRYDGSAGLHGNITAMSHLPLMQWDYRDQLHATAKQVVNNGNTPETTYYVYDADGQRVRKVTERQAAAGQTPTRMKERIYLGGYEIYREYSGAGNAIELERETLHIMSDKQRIALVETRTQGNDGSMTQLIRYQFGNHLGSVALELDDQAQIISYEEYYPYGSTSYQAVRNQMETPKRYRYTGKERDGENGLYYHGARYYACWLGRWTAPDPLGLADGANLYVYVNDNPILLRDLKGTEGVDPDGVVRVPGTTNQSLFHTKEGSIKILPAPETTLDVDPAFKAVAEEVRAGMRSNSYESFRSTLNGRIKKILNSTAEHPLKKILEIRDDKLIWKAGTAFENQELNYAHTIAQQSIKNLGAAEEAAVSLENLSPVGSDFHLKVYGHPEEIATNYMQAATEEAQAATKAAADELATVRLTRARPGQRGFVSIGGLIFALIAIGPAIYAVSQAPNKTDAIVQISANLAVSSLVFKLAGGGGVGFVVSSVIGMHSDNAALNRQYEEEEAKDNIAKDFIRKRIPAGVETHWYGDKFNPLILNQVKELLFETKPTVIGR
jgi:RHS repeat-associated protein